MANTFVVLDKMFESEPLGKYVVAFRSPDNFIEAKSGKDGWGWIKMAVNNDTITKMFLGNKIGLVLFAFDVDKYREISKAIEASPDPDGGK